MGFYNGQIPKAEIEKYNKGVEYRENRKAKLVQKQQKQVREQDMQWQSWV